MGLDGSNLIDLPLEQLGPNGPDHKELDEVLGDVKSGLDGGEGHLHTVELGRRVMGGLKEG